MPHPTHDQMMNGIHLRIAVHGFTLQGVLPDRENLGWTYTIGLSKSFDLPELVIVCDDNHLAADLLHDVIDELRNGASLDQLPPNELVPLEVHRAHLDADLFNMWRHVYDEEPSTVPVVQLRFGASLLCDCCVIEQVDLSDPTARLTR